MRRLPFFEGGFDFPRQLYNLIQYYWTRMGLYRCTNVNKNIIDVIDPFPDIFDNFDSLFIYFF